MRILYVCTANVCRSPSAAFLMNDAVAALRIPDVTTASAGVDVLLGASGCDLAPALRGRAQTHRARGVTPAAVAWADLILAATREHQLAITDCDPSARTRMFTILQAARIARWLSQMQMVEAGRARAQLGADWAKPLSMDDPRRPVAPLLDRDTWIVEELDAGRGLAPFDQQVGADHGFAGHPDDILDPHTTDPALHPHTYRQIWEATNSLAVLLEAASRAVGVAGHAR